MPCLAPKEGPLAHSEHAVLPQRPTCTNPGSMILALTSIHCSTTRESPLAIMKMPFLHKIQLVQTLNLCSLSILHYFVQQARESPLAHFEHALLAQNPTSTNPTSMLRKHSSLLCSAARESPLAHSEHGLLAHSPTCTNPGSILFDPTSMLCSAKRESQLAHSERAVLPQRPTCTDPGSMILELTSMHRSTARESPLAIPNMPFLHEIQLVQTLKPCSSTMVEEQGFRVCILHYFVQQQGKAHLPTLNMPFLHKAQTVQTADPCILTPLQCFV